MSDADPEADKHPFDVARENDVEVNDLLAETSGAISEMQYTGTIGYHIHVATGETSPEYLWRIALFQALDETLLEMVYIDGEDTVEAREQLERQLRGPLDPMTAESISDRFEENLRALVDTQREADDE